MRRAPRAPSHPGAEIQDLLFSKMARDEWSVLHRECVDKVTARDLARRFAPGLGAAALVAVIDAAACRTPADLRRALQPYVGGDYVAKPAHSCGGFLDLSRQFSEAALRALHERAAADYFHFYRESQYRELPRRIVVEQRLGDGARGPLEYKFHCAWGRPIGVQIDDGRYGAQHLRTFVLVDGFVWLPGDYEASLFEQQPQRPPCWDAMLAAAAQLSAPFDYVRVDLFDAPGGPYFSEWTLTPNGGIDYVHYPRIRLLLNEAWRAGGGSAI